MTSPLKSPLPPKGAGTPSSRGGWKNRFGVRKGRNKSGRTKQKKRWGGGIDHSQAPKEADNGAGRSLAATRTKRNQKKGSGLMQKLKLSFSRKGSKANTSGDSVSSLQRQESDYSGSIQSPFSENSFIAVEVRAPATSRSKEAGALSRATKDRDFARSFPSF